jgi:IS1 family transposase/transposase-like protein
MIVAVCHHQNRKKFGKTKAGTPRLRCTDCGKCFTESTDMFAGMRLGMEKACRIVEMLCEGLSIATTSRLTNIDPHTIIDLMAVLGERCEKFMAERQRDLPCGQVQADEIWGYVGMKQKTALRLGRETDQIGDCYTWTAMDKTTKLLVCWHFGNRDRDNAFLFCRKLYNATTGKFLLSTDGFFAYEEAVSYHLWDRCDYGQIQKMYSGPSEHDFRAGTMGRIIGVKKRSVMNNPEMASISTSLCERLNGSIRNYTKRMQRCTYAFSKKYENHRAAMALFFAAYNYCRSHKTLKGKTPAQAHGIADHKWTVRELLAAIAG